MRNFLQASLVVAISLLLAACATAPATGAADNTAASAIRAAMAADHIPAMTVAVIKDDELLWNEAFGLADVENQHPATVRNRFRLGSVSKVFTASLAARLAQQGRIDLDVPVRDYLPIWPDKHPPISLRQLLGHLGGIRHYNDGDFDSVTPGGMIDMRFYPDAASILALFAEDELVAMPGEQFSYSTFGFSLASLAMEAATGLGFETLLETEVLTPGGIDSVFVDHLFRIIPWRAENYDPVDTYRGFLPADMGPVVNALPLNSAYKIAGGGMVGDAESVARFGALHFAPGFLDEDMYRQVFTPQHTADGTAIRTGIGWFIGRDADGRLYYDHTGSQQGSRAYLRVYPEERLSIALLSNLGGRPQAIRVIADRVLEDIAGL